MWLLSCKGELLEDKRLWLQPGSTHLFGRTTGKSDTGERIRYIDNKAVSRRHLTIIVHPAAPGSSLKLHARSKIEFKDGSKIGTTVNGEKIIGTTKTLEGTDHRFRLGPYPVEFHLVWQPVVLCHSGGAKSKDAFTGQRQALEAADVKLLKDYVSNATTHAVSKKRNTAANLQALVQGRWLVTEGFVDAIVKATATGGGDEGSALEVDFDGNWPDEKRFLIPAGNVPSTQPDRMYYPNPERAEVFSDFIFLFLMQSQYDNLLPVITSGSGKALLWEVEPGESRVEDLVNYVKEVAGHKGASQFKLSQVTGPGGIVLIRPNDKDEEVRKFLHAAEALVYQESIEQSALLDVILTMDTSNLRQPLKEAPKAPSPAADRRASPTPAQRPTRQSQRAVTVDDSPPPRPEQSQNQQAPEQAEEAEEQSAQPTRKRQRRYITQSRFKNFDDDFDPSQFSKPASQSPAPSFNQQEPSQAPSGQDMDVDEPSQAPRTQQNLRKRPVAQVEEPDEDAWYEELLPGQAALKRQKLDAAARHGDRGAVSAKKADADKVQAKKKKTKELDVKADLQKRREKEEEERRKDEESLRNAMEGVNIEELKNLAQIDEMPLRDLATRAAAEDGRTERWDPSWNGRRNFKKFRPKGSSQNIPRLPRVIVALEEVPRKGQGIGDEYWLQTSRTSKSKSQSQSRRSQPTGEDDEHEDSARFRRRIERSRQEDAEADRGDAVHAEEIAGRARDEALQAAATQQGTPSQTMRAGSQRNSSGKRAAQSQAGGPPKRAKQSGRAEAARAREVVDLDADDGDELKFRRRRR